MTVTRYETGPRMSQAVVHGGLVYLSGQVGKPGDNAEQQTKTILAQIDALLAEAGTDRAHILSATIWLADMADFPTLNRLWEEWLDGGPTPARATGQVQLASPDYRVEILIIAARP